MSGAAQAVRSRSPRVVVGGKWVLRMDRSGLIEAIGRKTAGGGGLPDEEIGRVVDAVFGTVAEPGVIAEALKDGRAVTLVGFGSFHDVGGEASLRPGKALNEFVHDRAWLSGTPVRWRS